MGRRLLPLISFFAALLMAAAVFAGTDFRPVQIRTKTLTMTGVRQEPAAEQPRDYQFAPVSVTTKPLTMTGMRN